MSTLPNFAPPQAAPAAPTADPNAGAISPQMKMMIAQALMGGASGYRPAWHGPCRMQE